MGPDKIVTSGTAFINRGHDLLLITFMILYGFTGVTLRDAYVRRAEKGDAR